MTRQRRVCHYQQLRLQCKLWWQLSYGTASQALISHERVSAGEERLTMLGRRSAGWPPGDGRVYCRYCNYSQCTDSSQPHHTVSRDSQPTRREPTIISIFPRPDRLFISANQDGANIDNHIHIAADTARTLREHSDQGQTLGKVNDEHWYLIVNYTNNIITIKIITITQSCFYFPVVYVWQGNSCYSLKSKCVGCYLFISFKLIKT